MAGVADWGLFALGLAVGVLGLLGLLSLIVAYAYNERTLLALAAYVAVVVGTLLAAQPMSDDKTVPGLLLAIGPAALAFFQIWLLKNRQATGTDKLAITLLLLATLGLLALHAFGHSLPQGLALAVALVWLLTLAGMAIYSSIQTHNAVGPWKWWILLGQLLGLVVVTLFLAGAMNVLPGYWPVVLMLLAQVPPVYVSLVWRSRLRNEIRLRGAAASVSDPLTGLATTPVLIERLMRVMSREHQAKASHASSAIFLIQVQNWAGLMKELGSEFNEKLLLEAALRLRRSVGDNDLVARIHGGRFAVVAQGLASDEEATAIAMRLVVSGLRIDSPLLPGVELKFRVVVSTLRLSKPMALPDAQAWLEALAHHFDAWPSRHRARSILTVSQAPTPSLRADTVSARGPVSVMDVTSSIPSG